MLIFFFEDLEAKGLLGCGGFGYVELVQHKTTKVAYALKCISKGSTLKKERQELVMLEKNIQTECDSDFIIRLVATYNGDQLLYFLLELGIGGDLYALYLRCKLWGSDPHAKFYTAGVVFALEHMHRKKMIYRDLKPENIMITDKGHAKIADMGLATFCVGKTFTKCGTPDYIAPEVLAQSGHDHSVDWWMLGVLTFELMTGHPPFHDSTEARIYERITKGIRQVRFPSDAISPLRQYVRSMCEADPADRLPRKKGGVENIKRHKWCRDFAWDAMKARNVTPPYIPEVTSATDLTNFNGRESQKPEQVPYIDVGSEWDRSFATGCMGPGSPMARGANPFASVLVEDPHADSCMSSDCE